jgi:hypothetical protein
VLEKLIEGVLERLEEGVLERLVDGVEREIEREGLLTGEKLNSY